MNPGIHLIHKPVGPTSFSAMRDFATSAQPTPRVCHGGTLDPFASGLLLILVEPATRLFDHLHAIPKMYDATIRWGTETDNGDPGGKVVSTGDPANLTAAFLQDSLATFIGWHNQVPHATSAKRIGGERAYLKAHRGEAVDMPASRVYLHHARWLNHDLPHQSRLELTVRGGYYIRAMVRDLGRLLGCGAHLSHLHRQSIGPWTDPGEGQTTEIHGREIMPWAMSRSLSDPEIAELRQRREIELGELQPPEWRLPEGFPDSPPPIRGFQNDQFCCLLSQADSRLRLLSALWQGV
jgi:tRNA pseudouridine55 synthase